MDGPTDSLNIKVVQFKLDPTIVIPFLRCAQETCTTLHPTLNIVYCPESYSTCFFCAFHYSITMHRLLLHLFPLKELVYLFLCSRACFVVKLYFNRIILYHKRYLPLHLQ